MTCFPTWSPCLFGVNSPSLFVSILCLPYPGRSSKLWVLSSFLQMLKEEGRKEGKGTFLSQWLTLLVTSMCWRNVEGGGWLPPKGRCRKSPSGWPVSSVFLSTVKRLNCITRELRKETTDGECAPLQLLCSLRWSACVHVAWRRFEKKGGRMKK